MEAAIIGVFEAQSYAKALKTMTIDEVGSDKWMQQHEYLEKLNLQAHHSALTKIDEYVVEALIAEEKLPVLVHELLVVEVWKDKVFPLLLPTLDNITALKAYVILYHEATLVNLLEILLYHQPAAASLGSAQGGEAATELADYCYRKLTLLNSRYFEEHNSKQDQPMDAKTVGALPDQSSQQRLESQRLDIGFSVACSCVTILRYITENLQSFPMSLTAHLLDTHDVILSLVPLMENPPWQRKIKGGKLIRFINNKWTPVEPQDRLKVSALEGQVWLALYNLLQDPACRQRYHFNTLRKETVIQLRRFFNDALFDQLPLLSELRRTVEQLVVVDPPPPTASSLSIIEQVPEMREQINAAAGSWKELAAKQMATVFSQDPDARKRDLERLMSTFKIDDWEEMHMLENPVCVACGKNAEKRCSRCKTEWYCSRECQLKCWKTHKAICDAAMAEKAAKESAAQETAAVTAVAGADASSKLSQADDQPSKPTKPLIEEVPEPAIASADAPATIEELD